MISDSLAIDLIHVICGSVQATADLNVTVQLNNN